MSTLKNAYALVIGTNFDQENPLPEAEKDAKDIYNLLINEEFCGYPPENCTLLLDKDATHDAIIGAFDKLIETTNKNSSILFFYSGHGGDIGGTSSIVPYDFNLETKENLIYGNVFREKLKQLKSKRKVVLLDCCHSGGLFSEDENSLVSSSNKKKIKSLQQEAKTATKIEGLAQDIDDDEGIAIITSCQGDQLSYASPGDGNSIFTKCLMQMFKGEHLAYYEDRYINIMEAVDYINDKVPKLSNKATKGEATQIPYSNLLMSEDFIISQLPKNKWKNIRPSKYNTKNSKTSKTKDKKKSKWRDEGNRLLLFVHGFSGEGEDTFGTMPTLLQENEKLNGWAMKPLGYSSHKNPEFGKTIWASTKDIDRVWRYLKTSIENKFKEYDSIAIVTHSLGGLVAQKAILDLDQKQQSRISHFIMFGCPNNGIDDALTKKDRYKAFKGLSNKGKYISDLRKQWKTAFKNGTPFDLKTVYAIDDEFVSRESCFAGFKKSEQEVIAGRHLTMVKPERASREIIKGRFNQGENKEDIEGDALHLIVSTLDSDLEFYNKYTNKEEINLALGNYNAVLKRLLKYYEGEIDPNDLYDNEVRQIVFAYEGLGEKQKALDFLSKTFEHVGDKNDFLGFFGGRYKRYYLRSNLKSDAKLAFNYYDEGLKLARKKRNHSQKYYHAINLAFLSIVVNQDHKKMRTFAHYALRDANKSDDNWKWATIAEANMYLGNLETAKIYYEKAAKDADIRSKISTHTNAHAGYVALHGKDDQNDDFMMFLKATFLG